MTPGQSHWLDPPLDHVRAETYLRLVLAAALAGVEGLLREVGMTRQLRVPA